MVCAMRSLVRKSCMRTMRMRSLTGAEHVDEHRVAGGRRRARRGTTRRAARSRASARARRRASARQSSLQASSSLGRRDGGRATRAGAGPAARGRRAPRRASRMTVHVGHRRAGSRRRDGGRRAPRRAAGRAPRGPACGTRRAPRRGAPRRAGDRRELAREQARLQLDEDELAARPDVGAACIRPRIHAGEGTETRFRSRVSAVKRACRRPVTRVSNLAGR